LVEAWKIDAGTGTVAAGVLGRAALTLTPYTLSAEDAWHAAGDDDSGRGFFGGYGFATLPMGLSASGVPGSGEGLLAKVGDSITLAQRRWVTGLQHVRSPLPFSVLGFGSLVYSLLELIADGGPSPPRVYLRPRLSDSSGGMAAVIDRGVFRGAYPNQVPIPGTEGGMPGFPAIVPLTDEPAPALWIVSATMIAADVISFSLYGGMVHAGDGLVLLSPVCYNGNADGSVSDVTTPSTGTNPYTTDGLVRAFAGGFVEGNAVPNASGVGDDGGVQAIGAMLTNAMPGEDTIFAPGRGGGELRTLAIGGTISQDTIHQAALWARALTQAEVTWLLAGDAAGLGAASRCSLDRLFATIAAAGSQCPQQPAGCTLAGGLGTANPLLTATGLNALTPTTIARVDTHAIVVDSGDELRATRRAAEAVTTAYELTWQASDVTKDQYERVRQALAVTANGATTTRWRHPADDVRTDGTVCSALRYRIRNAAELGITRGRGGHHGGMRLVLERVD
jgi:hypothetical protein